MNPTALLLAEDSIESLRAHTTLLANLGRRYKFLEKELELAWTKILKFLKGLSAGQPSKLAKATALLIAAGVIRADPLHSLLSDSLTEVR